jgi:beta-lactamase regulating signal transducer with metallopeptidase domain
MEPLRYLVQANLILAVLVMAYALLLRHTTRFHLNRMVLWGIVGATLLLPLLKLPAVQPEPVRAVVNQTTELFSKPFEQISAPQPTVILTFPNGKTYPATFNKPTSPNWLANLLQCYGLVVCVLLLRLVWRIGRLRILIEKGLWTPYTDFMLVHAPVEAPFSFGGFVVMNVAQYNRAELDSILRHERVHVAQNHTLDILLAECLGVICWLNPAVYVFRRLVNQNLEYLADQTVLTEGVDARAYQFSLLRVSLGANGPSLTNRFGESGVASRVRMMLRPRSNAWVWLRYGVLAGVLALVMLVLSCGQGDDRLAFKASASLQKQLRGVQPKSPSFVILDELCKQEGWYIDVVYSPTFRTLPVSYGQDAVIGLKDNHLVLLEDQQFDTVVYVDGKETPSENLSRIQSEFIEALFLVRQNDYAPNPDDKPIRVVIETSRHPQMPTPGAQHYLAYLQAATMTKRPLGTNRTFSMNEVLEATFFHRKDVLVERTPNDHLKLYDEFAQNTDVLINSIPVSPDDVKTVHIREVQKIYTIERSFALWFRPNSPSKRFAINIETSPHRAQRDSSYYVFSPFYSGDF